MTHRITWLDAGRKPRVKPDPQYPYGIDLDISQGASVTCTVTLQYPAPRCGSWLITCNACGLTGAVTAAGRLDDPRSIKLACK